MGKNIFFITCFLIFWNICVVKTFTGPEENSESTEVHESSTSKSEINLEKLSAEFKTAIDELKQLMRDQKNDIKLELDSLKSALVLQNDKLSAETAIDDVKDCAHLQNTYFNCQFALMNESNKDGLYLFNFAPLAGYCQRFENEAWTIVLRRHYTNATADSSHYHNWDSYKNGFGNLNGDHFLGLEILHQMTKDWDYELWLQLRFIDGTILNLRNGYFKIGSEKDGYKLEKGLHIDNKLNESVYGDLLLPSYGMKFSTYDADNDENSELNCAKSVGFGWWYNKCNGSGIFGRNLQIERINSSGEKFLEVKELSYIHMAIRLQNI